MIGQNPYTVAQRIYSKSIVGTRPIGELIRTSPDRWTGAELMERERRNEVFREFFRTVLTIFRECLEGRWSQWLREFLLNDATSNCRTQFHLGLPTAAWTIPVFFRTDECRSGSVYEIQCPGSGWGDLDLLANIYASLQGDTSESIRSAALAVAQDMLGLFGLDELPVLHLLDNSSNPASMRYFMASSSPPIRYWGYDHRVAGRDCKLVRSHSFFGLVSENLFAERLRACAAGSLKFDLPPIIAFDQKAILCLPFLDETKSEFSNDIRSTLAYSYPLTRKGFRDHDGEWVTLDAFARRPPSRRKYFLKYGGCDVSMNWGSRSVFRMSEAGFSEQLAKAIAAQAECWIVQPEVSMKEDVPLFRLDGVAEVGRQWTAKVSCFYRPSGLVGIRTMHRHHFKVHGQPDTVIGIVRGQGEVDDPAAP